MTSFRAFGLVEIVVAVAVAALFCMAFVGAITYGEESSTLSGMRNRANFLADEGIEATRNVRDQSYANLVNGTYGLSTTTGSWKLSGSSNTIGLFTRTITIATNDATSKLVTSTVSWQQNAVRTASTSETTILSNTSLLANQAANLQVNTALIHLSGVTSNSLQGITVQNTGTNAIVIDKITVSWTNALRKITQVDINAGTVWSSGGIGTPTGSQSSGTALDITNVSLTGGAAATPITQFLFDGVMLINIFTITFTMSDGSTKTVVTTQL